MSNINVEVELEPGFQNYRLLPSPSPEEAIEAIGGAGSACSSPPAGSRRPFGAAYAAPLGDRRPRLHDLAVGRHRQLQEHPGALILSHFGDFSETNLPLSFESTSNALERNLFLAKDVLTVVDDWRPGVTRADSEDMDRKAQRLLRGVGNRQGRGRMTADTTLRQSYPPRGFVMATAEALPEVQRSRAQRSAPSV